MIPLCLHTPIRMQSGPMARRIEQSLIEESVDTAASGRTPLTAAQRHYMLALAQRVVRETAGGRQYRVTRPTDAALLQPAAVFVTLWQVTEQPVQTRRLRGCIGRIESDLPLYLAVAKAASGAAGHDPRFAPVNERELEGLEIEVALLSSLRPVHDLAEIELGRHGLAIKGQERRALLLPKVAPRMQWDKPAFLLHLCRKAGLPEDSWPGSASLYSFTAEVFSGRLSDVSH